MPPFNKFTGPPPGGTPQGLSSMLPGGEPPSEPMPMGEPNPAPGGGSGGLKDVFDEVQGVLDALASILPDQAEELDSIKTQLAEILAKAISGGATFKGREGQEGIRTPSQTSFPV